MAAHKVRYPWRGGIAQTEGVHVVRRSLPPRNAGDRTLCDTISIYFPLTRLNSVRLAR